MSPDDPDAGLVARVGRGDAQAARQLVSAKLPRLLALARRLLGDAAEAEDVAQETLLRAWRQAAAWRPGAARFDTWLHQVTLNLCRDRLRRRRMASPPALPEIADPAPPADRAIEEAARGRAVADAIAALPDRQREAILLVHYQDLGNIAAAAAMAISVEALESLLARGRRSLRATFAAQDMRDD
ncbi:RNA polymerase sigma factor [Sphingomonas morindae]|uniref:RNA polymerase sigma factor n=1 Tax=Sphingomonas morindae TaxID=1541170 RepID=A0ABY4XCM9_9SPHN|nr:RNA polymerase sigma factor [Sphingomonas morindae]USI74716.1 RNA polymerase sigma factor [Sphingomonas morindae]